MDTDPAVSYSGRLRRPTMRDVAARVGVSQTLVSLVLRNASGPSAETRARVLRAAAELGYRPDTAAQVLRRNRSRHIGVLFTMRQPFDVDLVEATTGRPSPAVTAWFWGLSGSGGTTGRQWRSCSPFAA